VISMKDGETNVFCKPICSARNPDPALVQTFTSYTQVTPQTPPTILFVRWTMIRLCCPQQPQNVRRAAESRRLVRDSRIRQGRPWLGWAAVPDLGPPGLVRRHALRLAEEDGVCELTNVAAVYDRRIIADAVGPRAKREILFAMGRAPRGMGTLRVTVRRSQTAATLFENNRDLARLPLVGDVVGLGRFLDGNLCVTVISDVDPSARDARSAPTCAETRHPRAVNRDLRMDEVRRDVELHVVAFTDKTPHGPTAACP